MLLSFKCEPHVFQHHCQFRAGKPVEVTKYFSNVDPLACPLWKHDARQKALHVQEPCHVPWAVRNDSKLTPRCPAKFVGSHPFFCSLQDIRKSITSFNLFLFGNKCQFIIPSQNEMFPVMQIFLNTEMKGSI